MKKSLLLTSAIACFTSFNANAMDMMNMRPYVGAEYVFSHAKQGSYAQAAKDNYHSGKFDLGIEWMKNIDTEFSYQMSGQLNSHSTIDDEKMKGSFEAYALDVYGKYPIMCSPLSAVGTIGGAIYSMDYKGLPNKSTSKVGYRAGVGMQYDFNEHFAARVIGRYSYINTSYLNNLMEVNAGMIYRF